MPAREETAARRWTARDLDAMPADGRRYEVVDGELFVEDFGDMMTPGPAWRHQRIAFRLMALLDAYVGPQRLGYVVDGPGELEIDPHRRVAPDVFVVPFVEGRAPERWEDVRRLLLAVEVLSPSTQRRDRIVKRRLYLELGAEYWIVDPIARLVERWRPGEARPEIVEERLAWHVDGAPEDLVIDLAAVFAEGDRAWKGTDEG